jgi:hypothetical protein
MLILGLLSWWYGAGWRGRLIRMRDKLAGLADYFSIGLLLRTLFSPFRQISAGKVGGSLNNQMRAFFDRQISRGIGAIVRSFMIIAGLTVMFLYVVVDILLLVLWGVTPLLPIIGIVLMVGGYIPWSL